MPECLNKTPKNGWLGFPLWFFSDVLYPQLQSITSSIWFSKHGSHPFGTGRIMKMLQTDDMTCGPVAQVYFWIGVRPSDLQ